MLNAGQKKNDTLSIFYNDEHPDGHVSFTHGHTKGVVSFGQETGFWLVHSVPKYPPNPKIEGYGYPHTGEKYGQSFLCVSLKSENYADIVGKQLTFNYPYIYSQNIPDFARKAFPLLVEAAKGHHVKAKGPSYNVATFKSIENSISFKSFAKFTDFGKDLYADLVAPNLLLGLLVETWPNGPGKMKSRCQTNYPVENIEELGFLFSQRKDAKFTTKHDHSKWGISLDSRRPFVCIGDINRMDTQMKRAGGTVCFENDDAWKAFSSIIKDIELCPKIQPKEDL